MMRTRFSPWTLIGILLVGGFLRFYQITEIPVGLYPDEAMNGNNALEAIATGNFKAFYPENNGREGLFINIQALSVWLFGNEAWALRVVSAVFGTLTILGVYLVAKELTPSVILRAKPEGSRSNIAGDHTAGFFASLRMTEGRVVGLLAAFFTATSYWHLNFSRIGFRAITLPFFATFAMYFLLKGLRNSSTGSLQVGSVWHLVAAGVFMGLGFQGYIAFRFMPFVTAIPILIYLWNHYRSPKVDDPSLKAKSYQRKAISCAPCAVALFLFVTFVVALPIGVYFLQNPQDFFGRSGQVSVFASSAPIKEFFLSNAKTIGMFFISGDCNWRHNYACQAELHPVVAVFFALGLLISVWSLFKRTRKSQIPNPNIQTNSNDQNSKSQTGSSNSDLFIIHHSSFIILLAWFLFMSLPATLTKEGLPHALRAIGMIPPVMILAAVGMQGVGKWLMGWLARQGERWPLYRAQLGRIMRELLVVFCLVLALVPAMTYYAYFNRWAYHERTYDAFSVSFVHIADYLKQLPKNTRAYVLVNMGGTEVRGVPMPAQTVMFLTDTFRQVSRAQKGITYVTKLEDIPQLKNERMVIIPMNGYDEAAIASLKTRFSEFSLQAPSDFLVFEHR